MKHRIFFFFYKILGIILCLNYWNVSYFWWLMAIYFLIITLVMAVGVYYLKFNYFINSIIQNKEEGIILTFDDGPNPSTTPQVLEILNEFNLKATFFIIGKEAEKHPDIVAKIYAEGHLIGNHSYSHSNYMTFFNSKKMIKDFEAARVIIKDIIGVSPNYFRPPLGLTSPKYTKMLDKVNYQSIGWTYRSFDTMIDDKKTLIDKTIKAIKSNNKSILLFHDTKNTTIEALPEILKYIKDNGIKVANLDKNIQLSPYEN